MSLWSYIKLGNSSIENHSHFSLKIAIIATIAWLGFLKLAPPSISPEDLSKIHMIPLPAELTLNKGQFDTEPELGCHFQLSV